MESNKIDGTIEIISSFISTNLTYLRLYVHYVKLDQFEIFIRRIHPKLKVLVLTISSGEIAYLDAHRWEQLIVQDIPELEKFSLEYCQAFDDMTEYNVYFEESNPFLSSFWLKRQWMFEIEIKYDFVIYTVRPYRYTLENSLYKINEFVLFRKRWYEQPNVNNSTMELSKSIRLSLSYIPPTELNQFLFSDFSRILSITQVRHLEILQEKILIDVLIGITNSYSLPQLMTMKLHSLSLGQRRASATDKPIVVSPAESINQITKVYLKKVFAIEEIYSLINMYPYLEIDSFDNMMMDVFVQDILKKIIRDSNQHLRTLCFSAATSNNPMIYNLEKMKNDYIINQVHDYIVLE
jgi:hypothetical protein